MGSLRVWNLQFDISLRQYCVFVQPSSPWSPLCIDYRRQMAGVSPVSAS